MPGFKQTPSSDRGSLPDFIDMTETQNENLADTENPGGAEGWDGRGHVGRRYRFGQVGAACCVVTTS